MLEVLIGFVPSRSYLFAITCFLPAQPVDVPRYYCDESSRPDFSGVHGSKIRPEFAFVCQHRPDDTCSLVGLRHASHIHVSSRRQLCQPVAAAFRLTQGVVQHGSRAMHEQPAQLAVASLADA